MDLLTLFQDRFSNRTFSGRPVEPEVRAELLEAARIAPTAHNYQPFHIYVLHGDAAAETMSRLTRCNYHAPLNLILTVKRGESWKRADGYDAGDIDIGIVGTHIMLAAEELGLGCCWIGVIQAAAAKEVLGLGDGEEVVTMLEIGYKAEGAVPGPMHTERKSLEQLVSEFPCTGI